MRSPAFAPTASIYWVSNTVLDIAKIESGQFTLNMSEYAIESVIETVRVATESLAQNQEAGPQDRGGKVPAHGAWR